MLNVNIKDKIKFDTALRLEHKKLIPPELGNRSTDS